MAAPLDGVRVLELGSTLSGPAATRLLADLGAEVFKVEQPEGDQLRTWGELAPDGTSWWFKSHNRNKRLLRFDLRDPDDARTVREIALRCDAVVENFRPGFLAKHGLDAATLRAEKPELIYVSVSGYGQTGPYASRPGYGNIAEAMGGLRYITGEPDGPPMRMGISIGDELAGLYAAIGVLAGLQARARDGRGDTVDVSLIESSFSLLEAALPEYVHTGKIARRKGNSYLRAAPNSIYPTRDGEWLAIGGNGPAIFRRLAACIGKPELPDDPRFATNQARTAHCGELDAIIAAWTSARDLAEAAQALAQAEVPAGPVMSIAQIVEDPQFRARGAVAAVIDDDGTPIATAAPVPRFTEHPARLDRAAGGIGRDQDAVMRRLSKHGKPTQVSLVDVSARDGLQDEPLVVSTDDKLEIAAALAAARVGTIEITSFVNPDRVPQLADADDLVPRLPRGARYSALVMNRRGWDRGLAAFDASPLRRDEWDLVFVTSASPRHAMANNNRTIDETLAIYDELAALAREAAVGLRAAVSCAFVSPWADEPRDLGRLTEIVARLAAGGAHTVTLADTVGSADPATVARTVAAVRGAVPQTALALHLHDTHGWALAGVYAGLEAGIRIFEGALAGLGGCPFAPGATGNLDLERLAEFLRACGADPGVEPDGLRRAAERIRAALRRARPFPEPAAGQRS